MSRYLEEAARALKSAEAYANQQQFNQDRSNTLLAVADGYATLAAIDKGLLPAAIVQDVLRAITDRHLAPNQI